MIRDDLSDDCLNLLRVILNVNPDLRMTAADILLENWFSSDSRKKRSHDEIL
jgi:serine/threonine protein kinase